MVSQGIDDQILIDMHDILSRVDERTKKLDEKMRELCDWRNVAQNDIAILTNADLPRRVRTTETGLATLNDRMNGYMMYLLGLIAMFSLILILLGRLKDLRDLGWL
jgi:hypothetical protein